MSLIYPKKYLDNFLEQHEEDKESIFAEIYSFLGNREFESQKDFQESYIELLSKEKNKDKELSSGLILQIGKDFPNLELRDKNFNFVICIDFLKRISVLDKKTNEFKNIYIISETYFIYYYQDIKKNKIKYKFSNSEEESSLFTKDFKNNIIYNKNFEYVIINPDFQEIYTDIYNILKKEKEIENITTKDLFNDYRILNFPEINKEDVEKIDLKPETYNDYCLNYKYLCYNKKIGMTLVLQKILIRLFQDKEKYFYCNMDFLYNEVDIIKIRNYLFFYLSFLFSIKKQEKYKNFIEKNVINLIYIYNGGKLIHKLLKLLYKNFGDGFTLYFDNVKSRVQLDIVNKFIDKYAKEDIFILIQINEDTLYSLFNMKFRFFEKKINGTSIMDDFEYYIPFNLKKINEKEIKKIYAKKLQHFFEKFDYEGYLYLLKVKYLIDSNDVDFYKLIDIDSFLEFLIVEKGQHTGYNVAFRNDYIKEIFDDYYINYISKFKITNNNIFYEITKSEEGINLERQITYDLIIKNMNITKIKIDKIFSIKTFPSIEMNKNQEYLFIQTTSNSPYYDLGYLYNSNGYIIFNACQIGINKPNTYLNKLDKEFILFDLSYFSQILEFEKGIKIDKIQFCLITSFNAFEENENYINKKILAKDRKYEHFTNMKNFCEENNYIFLMFNSQTSEFYCIDKNKKLRKTDLKFEGLKHEITKIFIEDKDILETKRLEYYYNPEKPKLLGGFELPTNFNEKKLNKEYNFKIKDDRIIYKKMFSKINDFNKEGNKEIKFENNVQNKI